MTGCDAGFNLVFNSEKKLLEFKNVCLTHNHPDLAECPEVYPRNRRLSAVHEETIRKLMRNFHTAREIKDYIMEHHGVAVTNDDLRHLREKDDVDSSPVNVLENVQKLVGPKGFMCVHRCEESRRMKQLAFTWPHLQQLFRQFGEVLMVDSTAQCNRGSYHLWHAVIVDCMGRGRSVFYAFIENETQESYERVLRTFVENMPAVECIRTVVMDKNAAQMNAVSKYLPAANQHFCTFHVAKNFLEKTRSLSNVTPNERVEVIHAIYIIPVFI